MADEKWYTGITEVKPNQLRIRGYLLAELMGEASFAEAVWLLLTGHLPEPQHARLIQALLMCGIDHGVTPPSAQAARVVTTTGASISQAVAAGVLAINASHGGAIEGCMKTLARGTAMMQDGGKSATEAASELLLQLKGEGKRMPGFGHRLHTADPRTARLRVLAKEAGVYGSYLKLADALEQHFEAAGKPLPLNVDGAVAAVLCELNVDPMIGNGFFILPRVAGLIAHFAEERSREKVMRSIDFKAAEYDGPTAREVP
jgi:citrate synthase